MTRSTQRIARNAYNAEEIKSPFYIACDVAFAGNDYGVVMVFKKEGENIKVLDSEIIKPTKNFMEQVRLTDSVVDKFKKLYDSQANVVKHESR